MKKINIIQKSEEFEKIIKKRNVISNRFFVIYFLNKNEKYHRFGISIPKKIGNSVKRNKLKRQIKSIIDKNNFYNKELDYVIIVRKELIDIDYIEKEKQLSFLFNKIDGVWNREKI